MNCVNQILVHAVVAQGKWASAKRECPECHGKGQLRANIYHLIKSIDCTEAYFKRYLNALVVDFEQHCYEEMSGAERVIKQRLNKEISD